jgi:hypothetical protein
MPQVPPSDTKDQVRSYSNGELGITETFGGSGEAVTIAPRGKVTGVYGRTKGHVSVMPILRVAGLCAWTVSSTVFTGPGLWHHLSFIAGCMTSEPGL